MTPPMSVAGAVAGGKGQGRLRFASSLGLLFYVFLVFAHTNTHTLLCTGAHHQLLTLSAAAFVCILLVFSVVVFFLALFAAARVRLTHR